MANINFPASSESPWYNEDNGITYVWYGSYWKALATPTGEFDARYVNEAGDTMTGSLSIADKITLNTDGRAEFGNTVRSEGAFIGDTKNFDNVNQRGIIYANAAAGINIFSFADLSFM